MKSAAQPRGDIFPDPPNPEGKPPTPSGATTEIKRPKMPTARQLALAADITTRFAEASVRGNEETYAALRRAAHAMGMAALVRVAKGEQ